MPVPAAARFMPQPGWDLTAAAATWWLRRSAGRQARRKGRVLDFSGRALYEHAAAPLLNEPLSSYVVDRGVAVHRAGGEDFRNGAAWLGGRNDAARKAIHAHARDLYNAGSKYRHGGRLLSLYDSRDHDAPPASGKVFDTATGRALVRKLLLHGLAVLDSGTQKSTADLCESAQYQAGSAWRSRSSCPDHV